MTWIVGLSAIAIAMGWVATAMIPAATVSTDEASFKFLPPETQGVAVIDVAALKNAPLVQEAMKDNEMAFQRGLNDFTSATGFDLKQDVDKVTIGKVGERGGLVIVQGRIDKFKVGQYLKDKGKETETYLGQTLYHDGQGAFVVFDNLVLMGQTDSVKKALDQGKLTGPPPLHNEFTTAMRTIEAGNQIWAVGDFSVNDLRNVGVRGPAPALEMLKSLNSGAYQMRVDTDVHARAVGNFADAESAKKIGELARGAIAIAKLQVAQRQPDFLRVLDGIQISTSGPTLTLTVEEPGDLLKKLQQKLRPAVERNVQ